jgi:hypothetical protein
MLEHGIHMFASPNHSLNAYNLNGKANGTGVNFLRLFEANRLIALHGSANLYRNYITIIYTPHSFK